MSTFGFVLALRSLAFSMLLFKIALSRSAVLIREVSVISAPGFFTVFTPLLLMWPKRVA